MPGETATASKAPAGQEVSHESAGRSASADRIDIDEYATTYEDASGNAFEAFQIPWTEVTRILGEKHAGDWEQDQALIRALRAAGAPEWVDAERFQGGWADECGWGIYGPARSVE